MTIPPALSELDVFPRIAVASSDRREHVLPFSGCNTRPDRIDKGVAEHWHKVVVLQDHPLNLLCKQLAFSAVGRSQVFLKLVVEIFDACLLYTSDAADE